MPLSYAFLFSCLLFFFFFFNDTATTEIYTLSLHDALQISSSKFGSSLPRRRNACRKSAGFRRRSSRSEEHTSELQSHLNLVCRLLLEKKKIKLQSLSPIRKKPKQK